MGFVHLHVQSCYSLLRGASRPEDLLARARERGMKALAITDRDGLYGAVPFFQKAREAGIKAILGAELSTPEGVVTCLVRNRTGYANLCRLITRKKLTDESSYCHCGERSDGTISPLVAEKRKDRHVRAFRALSRDDTKRSVTANGFDLVAELIWHQEGLYVLTASIPLLERLAGGDKKGGIRPGALFVELVRRPAPRTGSPAQTSLGVPPIETAAPSSMAQERAAERLRLPVVATNAVAFADPGDHAVHCVLTAIRRNGLVSDLRPGEVAHPEAWLKGADEMAALFRDRPDARRHAEMIADSCDLKLEADGPVFPKCDLDQSETPFSRLWKLAFSGATRRYRPLTPEVIERLRREVNVICRLGFAEYFLIMHDIVRFAHAKGIPTVGRGSAADSLVAYCLGISAVDPIAYELCFERFLNTLRPDCPDIDIDFCWRRRDEVIQYVFEKYGAERVAMVANHNCYSARSAFRDVARAFGMPLEEVNHLSAMLPHYYAKSIREAVRLWPESRAFPMDSEPCRTLVAIAEKIDRFPRHLSVHVGGMVIADTRLTDYAPLERSAKGPVVCQYDKEGVKAVGLVKMDILAQRSLSIVADTVRWVKENHGVAVPIHALPGDDPETARLLRRGATIGCFQIESPGMRSLLQMMRAANREDVIHGLSLIRPGPSGSGMKERYIRRRLGLEPVEYPHPRLADALGRTYGVMLYQEDILRVAHAVAGFSLAEGDALRRAIKDSGDADALEDMHRCFIAGACNRGGTGVSPVSHNSSCACVAPAHHGQDARATPTAVPPACGTEQAEELWGLLNNFAAYSYCKAHAATYGHISYQAAYLKARWPAEFLAAVLANEAGFYEPREYVEDARRLGVRILPPDVNRSDVNFRPEGNGIRVGLSRIKGISLRAVQSIIEARETLPFASLADFIARARLSRQEAEDLALCGALDCFGGTRPQLLWQVQLLFKERDALRARRRPDGEKTGVFARLAELAAPDSDLERMVASVPPLPDYPVEKRLRLELERLGFTIGDHPLAMFEKELRRHKTVPSSELPHRAGEPVRFAGWLVATRRAVTNRQEFMRFLTLEDRHGTVEAVLFPDVYQRVGHRLRTLGPYLVRGKVEDHYGSIALTVEDIADLSARPAALAAETPSPYQPIAGRA